MKNLSRLFFPLLLLVSFHISAQDENNPWKIEIGANAVDLYPVGEDAPLGDYLDEFYNVTDHWNILPSLSRVSVSRYLESGFTLSVAGTINRINKIGDSTVDDLSYYGLDGDITYGLMDLIGSKSIDPFIGAGGGYTWVEEIGAGTLNGTFGVNYWFSENIGLSAQSSYKHSFEDYLPKHWQHSLGLSVKFGGKDTDGDGIYDKNDACPDVPGLEAFNGCPDSDNDGIEDSKDDCPSEAGLAEFNGCPDSDSDGVADKNDDCPTVAGLKELNGCPDADGDGVSDNVDECPNEKGPSANKGCPWPDTDGDGILDKDDKCPNEAGTVANNGCPVIAPTPAVMKTLNDYAKTILFDSGRASIKQQSEAVLQNITAILKEYPLAKFSIDGHTDSAGAKSSNQILSERRANTVRDYLIANGIGAERLSAAGFGEDKPIDTNKTRAGRANNRRVEVVLKN